MSKLDSLLAMVDEISCRSDKLVGTVDESHKLILLIVDLNTSITKYDTEIDAMSQLATRNNAFLAEFQKLYERAFYLELNFGLNECYTNNTSFGNLYSEYDFLWNEFNATNQNTSPKCTKSEFQNADMVSPAPEMHQSPEKKVKNIISISDLNLKPLRCKDSKVQRQKSRYRLSEAYTLNPLLALPIREILESSTNTKYSNVMSVLALDHERGDDLSFISQTSVSGLPVSTSTSEEKDLTRTPPFLDTEPKEPKSSKANSLPMLFKSLDLLDLDEDDMEDSGLLNYDCHSLESKFEDFENFHHFLRRSRINLKECFPARLERSKSDDSILTVKRGSDYSSLSQSASQQKFHNPTDMVSALKKSLSNQPTLEAIYCRKNDAASKFKEHSSKLLASQKELDICLVAGLPNPRKTQKNFDLFKLMNSPLGSPRGLDRPRIADKDQERNTLANSTISNRQIPQRRKSMDLFGSSFASSFINFVSAPSSLPIHGVTATGKYSDGLIVRSPPEQIKKMKKNAKEPIALINDIKSKRLPPSEQQLRSGSGSFLTIGPNRTKIINHGNSSPFKKPTLRRLSQTLLTDALNESLLF
ncbi:hypothetical protein METBIDRAFT_223745 [Metschnikowia bicuspidata var. bicuspidata NRRL YB-4993]|uniref:Uncharacterized protein n=1 Tax=Metschnikowia bicuspidata var. bicuspidata NRRL YB-4993 TaxID=869754 RepID=A0A1A0H4H2_9ASCO|nr:hypothetical protein METBIDRAFT_223745 [Metschnikowia bicuspidata var. bicuspidata NRRL YB-4993]OBA18974.1 hypothetical protein METBIDRAFT_223745 [Metschnikowia bicuspidata var. bicuspidata NRRL YB-4993]